MNLWLINNVSIITFIIYMITNLAYNRAVDVLWAICGNYRIVFTSKELGI